MAAVGTGSNYSTANTASIQLSPSITKTIISQPSLGAPQPAEPGLAFNCMEADGERGPFS